jgi:hypothetical protein
MAKKEAATACVPQRPLLSHQQRPRRSRLGDPFSGSNDAAGELSLMMRPALAPCVVKTFCQFPRRPRGALQCEGSARQREPILFGATREHGGVVVGVQVEHETSFEEFEPSGATRVQSGELLVAPATPVGRRDPGVSSERCHVSCSDGELL